MAKVADMREDTRRITLEFSRILTSTKITGNMTRVTLDVSRKCVGCAVMVRSNCGASHYMQVFSTPHGDPEI